jgi:hypothetical protein
MYIPCSVAVFLAIRVEGFRRRCITLERMDLALPWCRMLNIRFIVYWLFCHHGRMDKRWITELKKSLANSYYLCVSSMNSVLP